MAFKMVDGKIWALEGGSDSFGGDRSNRDTTNQTGPGGGGKGIDIGKRKASGLQGFSNHQINGFKMCAGGNFRDNAAIFGMLSDL